MVAHAQKHEEGINGHWIEIKFEFFWESRLYYGFTINTSTKPFVVCGVKEN